MEDNKMQGCVELCPIHIRWTKKMVKQWLSVAKPGDVCSVSVSRPIPGTDYFKSVRVAATIDWIAARGIGVTTDDGQKLVVRRLNVKPIDWGVLG